MITRRTEATFKDKTEAYYNSQTFNTARSFENMTKLQQIGQTN